MNNTNNTSNANALNPSYVATESGNSPLRRHAVSPTRPVAAAPPPAAVSFDYRAHRRNRSLSLTEVVRHIKADLPSHWPAVQVVGGWLWLEHPYSESEPTCSLLFELGFHFNERRQLWQHPCGQFNFSQGRRQQASYYPAQLENSAP